MAKPILVANWKNNPASLEAARFLLSGLSKKGFLYRKISFFIAPPLTYLAVVSDRASGFARLASQDFPPVSGGVHTGLVTPDILKNFGVRLSIIGHSERRALGETDKTVAAKVRAALESGITPLVCVGERERDRDGEHFEFLRRQLKASLEGLRRRGEATRIAIAYEPVWAIGGRAKDSMKPNDLSQTVIFIRKVLTDLFGRTIAEKVPILYGGSVEPANAKDLFDTGIRGFLVGHASLEAKTFNALAASLLPAGKAGVSK